MPPCTRSWPVPTSCSCRRTLPEPSRTSWTRCGAAASPNAGWTPPFVVSSASRSAWACWIRHGDRRPPCRPHTSSGPALDAATQAVTLLGCASGTLPLAGSTLVVGLAGPAQNLASALPNARALPVDFGPTAAQRQAAVAQAGAVERVIVLTWDATAWPAQQQLIDALAGQATPLIAVSVDLPYDLDATASASAQLATYGAGATSMAGLARALTKDRFDGRLPVSVPGAFSFGSGSSHC